MYELCDFSCRDASLSGTLALNSIPTLFLGTYFSLSLTTSLLQLFSSEGPVTQYETPCVLAVGNVVI